MRIRYGATIALALLIAPFSMIVFKTNAQPIPPAEFASITNSLATMDNVGMVYLPRTSFTPDSDQQRQINLLALDVAKEMARMGKDTNLIPANRNKTLYTVSQVLVQLAQRDLLTEPKVIPYLIEDLKHTSEGMGHGSSLPALCMMTRRMWGVVGYGGGEYSLVDNPTNLERIIAWWDGWWKNNEHKHPVYDREIEQQVQHEFLQMEQTIEKKVKPQFPVLKWFTAETNLPHISGLYGLSTLNEVRYSPSEREDLLPREANVWLEIAARFQYPEMPTKALSYHVTHPPFALENLITKVASRPIKDSDIVIEVKVATPDEALVGALKKALSQ